ncbi:MAG: response regulator [Anaerolineae bacterium]|nr:response regulator [Anaerolineae bacterium]
MQIAGEGGTRVLLISGNEAFAHATVELLGRHRDLALVGGQGIDRRMLAQIVALEPEVVLVDLDLPDQAGLAIIRRIREEMPYQAIVALTALEGDAYRRAALAIGSDEFVSKARLTVDLLSAIRRLAEHRS